MNSTEVIITLQLALVWKYSAKPREVGLSGVARKKAEGGLCCVLPTL